MTRRPSRVYSHLFDRAEQAQRTRALLETKLGEVIRNPQTATAPEEV